ncbi:hypothetical protein QE152_g22627 [Popillia japonica]|uniref:Uncharacterized protein n=1 Tax=Popillia japonica TaxID=7064 RepID=A0AAW1KJN9_POPJA
MSDSDSPVNSTSAEKFGHDSGSENLPTSSRQKRKRYGFSKYEMISETNVTTTSSTENDKTETVAVCDSGSKRKKQQHSPMQDSGTSGSTSRKKFCDFQKEKAAAFTNAG